MFYYTYVIKSKRDNKFYIGFTENLKERLKEHHKGLVKATRNRRPFTLVYCEVCLNKNKAIKREKYFKTGFGRRFLRKRIEGP